MAKKAAKKAAKTLKIEFTEEFAQKVRMAFQNVAEACGSDILQTCAEMGERQVIDREVLYEYLELHGGKHGREVQKWLNDYPPAYYTGNDRLQKLEQALDSMRVPRTWD